VTNDSFIGLLTTAPLSDNSQDDNSWLFTFDDHRPHDVNQTNASVSPLSTNLTLPPFSKPSYTPEGALFFDSHVQNTPPFTQSDNLDQLFWSNTAAAFEEPLGWDIEWFLRGIEAS
jgi:hypothetical protein